MARSYNRSTMKYCRKLLILQSARVLANDSTSPIAKTLVC